MQLLELPQYEDERNRLKDFYGELVGRVRSNGEVFVVGSTVAKILLTKPKGKPEAGFLVTVMPQSGDIDVLIHQNTFSKISDLITASSFPILEVNYRSTGVETIELPVPHYTIGNDVDVFVGKVGVIPANPKAYTSGGSINIAGYVVNVPYPPFAVATWINPLAATDIRLIRSAILSATRRVENGKEKLEAEVDEEIQYVAEGSGEVKKIKEELESKNPNNSILHNKYFINYDEIFEKTSKYITTDPFRKKLLSILTKVGQPKEESEETIEIIAAAIRNYYPKAVEDVKRR